MESDKQPFVVWLTDVGKDDVSVVGGKNASLGEMLRELSDIGIRTPEGFATTAHAYRAFVEENRLDDELRRQMKELDGKGVGVVGPAVREAFREGSFSDELRDALLNG